MTDNSFLRMFSPTRVSRTSKAAAVLLAGLPVSASFAADYTWLNTTGNFTDATKWSGGLVPTGTNATDVLIFGSAVSGYTATNNSASNPFLINQLVFSTGAGGVRTIQGTAGTAIRLGGTNPMIIQNGSAEVNILTPIQLGGNLTLNGTGTGVFPNETNKITVNGTMSGNFDIVKNGSFTFRFGSTGGTIYSQNTWFGGLTINDGTVRFNNNAYSAPIALRSNPVTLTSANAFLYAKPESSDPAASLRLGTLNGPAGTVQGERGSSTAGAIDSLDIVITTLTPGTFGGTVKNNFVVTGDGGKLVIRGVATQTFTGILNLAKDVSVGFGAGMTLAGTATHQGNVANNSSAVIIQGGNFTLDNTTTNNPDRLKNAAVDRTGLETIGGGKFSLIANAAGTAEALGRLQLGSNGSSRSGALTVNATSNGGTGAELAFSTYIRVINNSTTSNLRPTNTVNFTANDGQGSLGTSATGSRIKFSVVPTLLRDLLPSTLNSTSAAAENIGWATVNGQDFASYDTTLGVKAVTTAPAPAGTTAGSASTNGLLTTSLSLTNAGGYSINSLKIVPGAPDLSIDIATTGTFRTHGVLLAGPIDFAINASSSGTIAGPDASSPRYFHVEQATLTVGASLDGNDNPVVKAGQGLLNLTSPFNITMTGPLVINEGAVRSALGNSLPGGEIRFRGGVLEISGGGTLTRTVGGGSGSVNWSGVDGLNAPIGEEQGSGGFAAVGADATVNLTSILGGSTFAWEDTGFINSGHALIFGSPRANAKLTWADDLNLTSTQVPNYNAREVRVVDNPSSTTDLAVITGRISGSVQDDLLKTGAGTLILTSATNSYLGATLVHEGVLLVNDTGTIQTSFLTNVRNNATLGGNGRVGRVKVESGGTIAPGNAIGNTSKLTTGDVLLSDVGAKLAIELGGTTIGGDGVNGYDQLVAIGEVVLNGGTLVGTKLAGFTANPGALFFIVDNDGTDPVQGMFAQGTEITIGGELFNISYTGDLATNAFTGGNDIVLEYVPEPTSAALLAFGAAALGLARRRRPATA